MVNNLSLVPRYLPLWLQLGNNLRLEKLEGHENSHEVLKISLERLGSCHVGRLLRLASTISLMVHNLSLMPR